MSDPRHIYSSITVACQGLLAIGFTRSIPIFWRANDPEPMPDVVTQPLFLRNEIEFGAERTMAFGGGQFGNLKGQFGSVVLRGFAARMVLQETDLLDALGEAVACFRSKRIIDGLGNNLSFIGEGSGFRENAAEDGNWFIRGCLMVFQYRFSG